MDAGKLLKYDDTIYLQSNQFVDTKYSIESKWKYNGYINTYDSAAVVSYFLPDLAQGVAMTVAGIYTSFSYDTTTFIMTVTFPANTQSKFLFTIADPCMLSCYYPDTSLHIVNMFLQRGRTEALAHKLKILQPSGYLHMADGAVMNICEYNWLHNKDSLILEDEPNDEPFSLPSKCNPVALSQRLLNQDHIRTSIVVNDKATLVLDSGSYTQIGANSSIYVLPGGTLIIKPNAVVEIGSADVGHGEIIADQGANVCVSPGAIIRFHRNDLDSTDKNLFFVLLNNQSNPNAVSKTNSGISGYVQQMLIDDTLIDVGFSCQPFCDFKSILPPYGIINRDWGYAPFVTPRSSFKVSVDTICPGDSVVINFKKVLNEEGYRFTICKVIDTIFTTGCISGDTSMIDENYIISSDLCLDRIPAPELYKFRVWDTGWFKINMQVYNDCSETHDSTKYIYVPAPPEIVIEIPDSICPGVGTLVADGSSTQSHLASTVYRWAIQLVVPDSVRLQVGGIDYGGDWGEFDSTSVSNSFDFPDFRFVGGFKYAIGLSVKGWCGWVTKWDTVEVPLGVMVKTRLASNYQNPVGPSAFEIQGYITGATSYSWSPTDYLDEPDSLKTIARPDMPIEYILTVSDGLCDDSDTIFVSHNNFAYAGDDNLLCMGKGLVLGTNYNGFSLLSVINYLNNSELTSQFSTYETTLDIPKYFTHFMLRKYNFYSNGLTNTFKDDTLLRRYLMEMPDYTESFKKFNQNSNSLEALSDMHNAISSDSWLQNYLATTSGYAISNQECVDLFNEFNSWYDPSKFYEISWEHKLITDTSWTLDSNWIDNFNRTENDSISRNHRITVNDVTNSIIEYDEILLKRDTVISVGFTPLQLGDSTVFFSNFSTPVNSLTKYYWNFGDGVTSVLKMPVHTFISMDSTYLICLTAINECDSFTYCDTLTLDSNGMHFTFGKRSIHQSSSDTIPVEIEANNFSKTANKLSLNRPNPFSHNTIIEYELEEGYSNAEIRITNTLGQSLKTIKLKGNRGNTIVDGSQWALGMYIYTLIVDGVIIDNRSMVLAR